MQPAMCVLTSLPLHLKLLILSRPHCLPLTLLTSQSPLSSPEGCGLGDTLPPCQPGEAPPNLSAVPTLCFQGPERLSSVAKATAAAHHSGTHVLPACFFAVPHPLSDTHPHSPHTAHSCEGARHPGSAQPRLHFPTVHPGLSL